MRAQYIEAVDGVYRLTGTRVSLDSCVRPWYGQTAESIAQSFPALTLEQVYGALAFYLAHKWDRQRASEEFEALRESTHDRDPMFYKMLADAPRQVA